MVLECVIPGNPDIAGIGVRIAIYVQNILCFFPALVALWDDKVTQGELDYAEMQTTTNLVLAFAILISSVVQARTMGMTNYHANIVLMMSWMNNTNAFVYFILYIHHKIGLPEGKGRVDVDWKAWMNHVRERLTLRDTPSGDHDTESGDGSDPGTNADRVSKRSAIVLVKRFVLVLGSLHLTLMAALGIWLWRDPHSFGMGNQDPALFQAANQCTMDSAVVAILGQDVRLNSSPLRIFSLVIYSLFIIPGVNLIPPMILFLVAYFACRRIAKRWEVLPAYIGLGILFTINIVFIVDIETTRGFNRALQDKDEGDWGFGQILAILLLLLPLRDLVEAILARRLKQRQRELDEDLQEAIEKEDYPGIKRAIERGSAFPSPKSPDQQCKFWNLVSAHDLGYFVNLRRTRMTNIEKALESALHAAIIAKSVSRITALYHDGADLIAGVHLSPDAAGLILRFAIFDNQDHIAQFHAQRLGRHVNDPVDGETAVMFALKNDKESIAMLLLANPLINFSHGGNHEALIAASERGHDSIAKMLLDRDDIQPDAVDDSLRTALICASEAGHDNIARMLLERSDIEPNAADHYRRTSLILASRNGHDIIAKMLLERDDIRPNGTDHEGSSALIYATREGHSSIVQMLLERRGVQPNTANNHGSTALILAAWEGRKEIAKMLLERADVWLDAAHHTGRTALIFAAEQGHDDIARMILGRIDIQPNAADQDGRTALIWASQYPPERSMSGREAIVEMLLLRDDVQVNLSDKYGWTALMHASRDRQRRIVGMLLGRLDVDLEARNDEGQTAREIAIAHSQGTIARMIHEGRLEGVEKVR